jgi:RNA polymerase sigma-70 factor (ECF subfamily)
MIEASDAELMARVRGGDREAFGVLVDRHKDRMVNYVIRLTGCRERAEEVAQETFLRLYQAAPGYRERGRFTAYLYRIATNLIRREERRERRWRLLSSAYAAGLGAGGNGHFPLPEAPAHLLREELEQQLASALARLPIRYRVPVVLRDVQGWPYRSIAHVTGCREGTVKSRINRGRQQLRQWLEPYRSRGETN